jgi:predicted Zn-dependent protease
MVLRFFLLLAFLMLLGGRLEAAQASRGLSLIRDAEIEDLLRDYTMPLLVAGGLSHDAITITLVRDEAFNAFVAGGQRIFVHTGLLQQTTTPAQVIGVLAHESGHIAGGHLARMRGNMENASTAVILSTILGAAAAVGSGDVGAGAAVLSGATNIAQRTLLRFSRGQEQAADQFGVRVLQQTGWSAHGLQQSMEILRKTNAWKATAGDPYLRSHPLTDDRIRFFQRIMVDTGLKEPASAPTLLLRHARMRGKLQGFLGQPQTILLALEREPPTSTDAEKIRQQYAKAIALYRLPDEAAANAALKPLEERFPNDPYFKELKAQMALERGDVQAARKGYEAALNQLPQQPLLHYALASSLLASNQDVKTDLEAAAQHLEFTVSRDAAQLAAWSLLAQAYGRLGRTAEADLALAERYWRIRNRSLFNFSLTRAEKGIRPTNHQAWQRLQDLQQAREAWEGEEGEEREP